jgi:hypothetical protein
MDLKDDMAKMVLLWYSRLGEGAVRHNSQNTLYAIDLLVTVDLQTSNARLQGILGVFGMCFYESCRW